MLKKLLLIAIFILPCSAHAATAPQARIFDLEGKLESSFAFFEPEYSGSASLALGDIDADSRKEILVCPGSGHRASARMYGYDGSDKGSIAAFAENFRGGCSIASANTAGKSEYEVIVSAGYGGGPHVRIFMDGAEARSFFAFSKTARQGVRIASADLGSDGKAEIIAYSNLNSAPEYSIFGNDGHLIANNKLSQLNSNGVELAAGDFDGDGKKELAVAGGFGNKPDIYFYDNSGRQIRKISYDRSDYSGGLNLAGADINSDGKDELIVSESFNGSGRVIAMSMDGRVVMGFDAFDGNFSAGLKIAVGDVDGDGRDEIVAVPERIGEETLKPDYKSIVVDLSKQTLYRYQNGSLLDQFLISSGLSRSPTPTGDYKIYLKRPKVRMSWYYGPDSPLNYDLPNVPWVASFSGPFTIHGTYWHNNFGRPMSHGCVNMRTPEAKLVYDWVAIGTPITITKSLTDKTITKL